MELISFSCCHKATVEKFYKMRTQLVTALGLLPSAHALWLGGGLTILTKNNLESEWDYPSTRRAELTISSTGAPNDGSGAILVSQPCANYASEMACTLLGEKLWNPDTTDFKAGLNSSLAYQAHIGAASKKQLYWISKKKGKRGSSDDCRAMDATGKIHNKVNCWEELPTLCTQSAPLSSAFKVNNSRHWQIDHFVGNQKLTGYRDYHTFKFQGLPYAKKTARFAYSEPADYDTDRPGEIKALTAGTNCPQEPSDVAPGANGEDCLYANVWTPFLPPLGAKLKSSELKAVWLHIHGGGFKEGSGNNSATDGTNLASRGDIVVVSFNYRVGALGFLNLNDGVHKGNYAISDMVSALKWVNKYIQYFGGDPNRVTLVGESAGGQAINAMLATKQAKGLFHRAIAFSAGDGVPVQVNGGYQFSFPYMDTLDVNYEKITKGLLEEAGCLAVEDKAACLSQLSGLELVTLDTVAA